MLPQEDDLRHRQYHDDPDACDFSELTVINNVVSGRKDVITLFWENKLGIDVNDNYRIIVFEGSERLDGDIPLKSHLTLADGPRRPSDRFFHLHFQRCLAVCVFGGDPTEDYRDQEIDTFMEELGVYDDEIDTADPQWETPLGKEVYADLMRQKLAG